MLANSIGPGQTAHLCSLARVYTVCIVEQTLVFLKQVTIPGSLLKFEGEKKFFHQRIGCSESVIHCRNSNEQAVLKHSKNMFKLD